SDEIEKGVVFCVKSLKPQTGADGFSLEPYYLVHVDKNNEIRTAFSSAKLILDMYKNLCLGKDEAIKELVAQFEKKTNNYSDMQHYQTGLKVAIESIIGKKEESGMNSLFSRGGTSISTDGFNDSEDFELISFLVIE
ncbi:MAG: hypothetical protein OEL19_10820, partial [Sulfurimonas sp.]|nr:hypothetical protein [Sulfurimonas sp.]